jgi:hypothetical protein
MMPFGILCGRIDQKPGYDVDDCYCKHNSDALDEISAYKVMSKDL